MMLEVMARKFDKFGWDRMESPVRTMLVKDWMDALCDYPIDEIHQACRRAVEENPGKMPNEGHIKRLIIDGRRGALLPRGLLKRVVEEISQHTGIPEWRIVSKARQRDVVRARFWAIWRMRQETKLSLPQIGALFDLDHTSILNAIRRHEERMENENVIGEQGNSGGQSRARPGSADVPERGQGMQPAHRYVGNVERQN